MASIVVFGKPRAFESYEYNFGGEIPSVENAHSEPILKPVQFQESILHYYAREGYAGVEYYTRAKGFDSERVGIVFGISLKSSTDFSIYDTILRILQPLWVDFASALIGSNNQFIEDSITARLKNTQWSNEEIEGVQSTSLSRPIPAHEKGILLLVSENLEDIVSVESLIKEYSDVYISSNPDVFKESCNEVVFKEAEKQIFKIEGEQIVPWPEEKVDPPEGASKGVFGRIAQLPWGKRQDKNQGTIAENSDSSNDTTERQRKGWLTACAAILALGLIVGAVVYFWPDEKSSNETPIAEGSTSKGEQSKSKAKPDDLDGISVKLYEYPSAINNSLDLRPKILPETCTSYYPSDITFRVSDESLAIVKVDKNRNMYILEVKKHPNVNTKITVQAFIREKLLGEQTYTIAKNEVPVTPKTPPVIPPIYGKQRTLDQYLSDLERGLNDHSLTKEYVLKECQRIINSTDPQYHMNVKVIQFRDKVKNMDAESAI